MLNILMLDLTGSVFMCEVELGSGLKARGKTCSGEKTNIREVIKLVYMIHKTHKSIQNILFSFDQGKREFTECYYVSLFMDFFFRLK